MTLLHEVADREGIFVGISGGKTLIGHVEECVVATRLDSFTDIFPLFNSWIDTGWIVCTCVKQEDASLGSSLDICDHALKVETNCVFIVVSVLFDGQARVFEDSSMVCPRWVWNVDFLCTRVESFEESTTNSKSTGSRDGLSDDEAIESAGIGTVCEDSGSLGEFWYTCDTGVFFVELCGDNFVF